MVRKPGQRALSTAQPHRIIYYTSLPDPSAKSLSHPTFYPSAATQAGIAARTPHEIRELYDAVTSGRNVGSRSPSSYAFSMSAYPDSPYPAPSPSNLPVTLAEASQQDYSRYRAFHNLPRYVGVESDCLIACKVRSALYKRNFLKNSIAILSRGNAHSAQTKLVKQQRKTKKNLKAWY